MVTKEEAIKANMFHFGNCESRTEKWRRNGQTKTWKTRPEEFKVPIKFGFRSYGYLTDTNAQYFHTEENCPLRKKEDGDNYE